MWTEFRKCCSRSSSMQQKKRDTRHHHATNYWEATLIVRRAAAAAAHTSERWFTALSDSFNGTTSALDDDVLFLFPFTSSLWMTSLACLKIAATFSHTEREEERVWTSKFQCLSIIFIFNIGSFNITSSSLSCLLLSIDCCRRTLTILIDLAIENALSINLARDVESLWKFN